MKNETAQVGNCLFIDQRTLKDWNRLKSRRALKLAVKNIVSVFACSCMYAARDGSGSEC